MHIYTTHTVTGTHVYVCIQSTHTDARPLAYAGAMQRAMEMFSDLRQFDEAKKWAEEYSRTRGDTAQVRKIT